MECDAEKRAKEKHRSRADGKKDPYLVITLILLVAAVLMPTQVVAEPGRIVLDFGNSHMHGPRGEPVILFLKKEVVRQYPGIDVSRLVLRKAGLIAESAKGEGRAQLRIGANSSAIHGIHGIGGFSMKAERRHRLPAPVYLDNPFKPSWGPWQLLLYGDFTVYKVILEVENRTGSVRKGTKRRVS